MRYQIVKRAVPALLVGAAVFFVGCRARIPEKKVEEPETVSEQFERAEEYREKGDDQSALKHYETYLGWSPEGEDAPVALHRMGDIYFSRGEYPKALTLYKRISDKFEGYGELSLIDYKKVLTIYLLGDYRESISAGLKWLEKYKGDHLEGKVKILIGDGFKELGYLPRAFEWWLKASIVFEAGSIEQNVLSVKLESVIGEAGREELEGIVDYAVKSPYEPAVYYRLAYLYLQENKTGRAKKAATSLLDSTSDPEWLSKGYSLLESIRKGTTVRRGAVGCLLPLSGPFSVYGEEVLKGIQLGMGLFGNGGGDDAPELVIRDTKGIPEEAIKGLKELVEDENVVAIVGPLSSRCALAAAGEAQKLQVPIITLAQKAGITDEGDMVFRNFLTPNKEVEKLLSVAMGELGIRRFAILYPENSYGKYLMSIFWDRLSLMGGMVASAVSYLEDETDFERQIEQMTGYNYKKSKSSEKKKAKNPRSKDDGKKPEFILDFDAIFIPDNFRTVAMIAAHLAYHDVKDVQLLGTSLWQSPDLIELGGDYLQGALFTSGYLEDSVRPVTIEFAKSYRQIFESDPGILAATGYDTIRFLKNLILEGKVVSRRELQRAILSSAALEGVTGNISFDNNGEIQKDPLILTIKKDRFEVFSR